MIRINIIQSKACPVISEIEVYRVLQYFETFSEILFKYSIVHLCFLKLKGIIKKFKTFELESHTNCTIGIFSG